MRNFGQPSSRQLRRSSAAFTLIELLVATAVLALLLVLVLQITNHTLDTTHDVTSQMDSTQAGRRVLDALSNDIANSVISTEATILCKPANNGSPAPTLAMITTGRGPSTEAVMPRFLAVKYQLVNNQIIRGYSAVPWTPVGLLTSTVAASTGTSVMGDGILQFTVLAKLENGETKTISSLPASAGIVGNGTLASYYPRPGIAQGQLVPTGWTALVLSRPPVPSPLDGSSARVLSLVVAIAVVDEQNLQLLKDTNQLGIFSQPLTADPLVEWESSLAAVNTGLPGPARAAIRFLSKTISLQ